MKSMRTSPGSIPVRYV